MVNIKEKAYNRTTIFGFLLIIDISFFILLILYGSSTFVGIYGGLNVFIFPFLVYNFIKGLIAYCFELKEEVFKIIFFSIFINIPFLFPLVNYMIYGRIDFGGFTAFENSSTLLKLFGVLDGVLLPIIAFSYLSIKKGKIEFSREDKYEKVNDEFYGENSKEYIDEDEQGNVQDNYYKKIYGADEEGNTEQEADEYSLSSSNKVNKLENNRQDNILDEKENLKKGEIKQIGFDKDDSKT